MRLFVLWGRVALLLHCCCTLGCFKVGRRQFEVKSWVLLTRFAMGTRKLFELVQVVFGLVQHSSLKGFEPVLFGFVCVACCTFVALFCAV